ncbi:transglycosylase SLT domain-containing protein, partial [Okeania hirsuta]|uniref:transglycosylase SLT domain-containing protein n=1 Tax=Okeania hirsuta TaxID=1458930 RepID=UPI00195FB515
MPSIDAGIRHFQAEDTDPWFAQSILLIESPGQLRKSPTGAVGHFQLMPGVGRQMGLKVNREVDEREDFEKSARAAARFIKNVCIPETRDIFRNPQRPQYLPNRLLRHPGRSLKKKLQRF